MSSLAIGLALAVVASLALNSSYLLQHVGSLHGPVVDPRHPFATFFGLLRSPLWAFGAVLGITGWAIHVAALSHAPLSLVQAFVAGGLGLLAPVAARLLRQRLTALEWAAAIGIVVALVMLSIGLRDAGPHAHLRPAPLSAFLAAAFAGAALLAAAVRSWRSHALGLAGGILYGAADTTIKGLTGIASAHGVLHALASPWLPAVVAATAGAFFCFQRGLQTGRAIPVVVLMTGGTTVVSVLGGFAVFGDPLGRTPALAALHVVAFVLVTAAAAVLAPAASLPPEERVAESAEADGTLDGGPVPAAGSQDRQASLSATA